MRFSPQFLDEIRARVPVSDIVGRRVAWDRRKTQAAKGDFWACCPFHSEKTPSFHADNRKGIYHCFGCQATGDIFRFLVDKEGLSFPEAVERLAAEAGLPMPKEDPRAEARERERQSLHDVLELAAGFYEAQLQSRAGAAARGYLADRGLEPPAQMRFRLGYAPGERYALKEHLAGKGVSREDMICAGLLISGDDIAVPFDRFRDRIMFPIMDLRGRMVGFGGRALGADAKAKYLNSPETELFHKGTLLYNGAAARAAAHERGSVIAVEGYMDVIALAEAGIANVVAPLGTALTGDQLALLWRMADEPVLCFDGDQAGVKAAWRAIDTALPGLKPGKSLFFALLPDGQDPDDLVRGEGRAAFDRVVAQALPLVDMLWRRETEGQDFSTPERRAAFEARLGEILRQVGDEAVRRHYMDELRARTRQLWGRRDERPAGRAGGQARAYGADQGQGGAADTRWRRPQQVFARGAAPRAARADTSSGLRRTALVAAHGAPLSPREGVLVLAAINHPAVIDQQTEEFAALDLTNATLDRLRRAILDIAAHEAPGDAAAFRAALSAAGFEALVSRLDELARRGRERFALAETGEREALAGWRHAVALHRKSVTLHKELMAAERAFAEDGSEESLARLNDVRIQIQSVEGTEALMEGFGE